jgi:hypothetical protein
VDQEQVLQEFVDAAERGRPYFDANEWFIFSAEDSSRLIRKRRPEFLKDRVAELLPQREEWNTKALCCELGLKHTLGEANSLAKIVIELGWKSRKGRTGNVAHFRKSFDGYVSRPGPIPYAGAELDALRNLAVTRERWLVDDLCDGLGLERVFKNQGRIGTSMRLLGWKSKLTNRPRRRTMYYR